MIQGPEIRTGKLAGDVNGKKSVNLVAGQKITLRTDEKLRNEGSTEKDLYINYMDLKNTVLRAQQDGIQPVKVRGQTFRPLVYSCFSGSAE